MFLFVDVKTLLNNFNISGVTKNLEGHFINILDDKEESTEKEGTKKTTGELSRTGKG